MNIAVAVVAVGFLVFLAHAFAAMFSKLRIPDVLLLILIGLLIGPVFHLIKIESFGAIGPVFTTITLVIILFEGGTGLKLDELRTSIRGTTLLTNLNFFATTAVIGLIGWFYYDLEPLVAFMLGSIVGGTSSAVVIPMVKQLNMGKNGSTILILESAFSDVLCIVFALALMEAIEMGSLNVGVMLGNVLASFVLASMIGLFGSVFWSMILHKVRTVQNSIFTTPAFVFIIFGISELLGYSGAIAALTFGIGLANMDLLASPLVRRYISKETNMLNDVERILFSEVVFLLKTFFFVYIGISIRFDDISQLVIGLILSVVLLFLRIPIVKMSISSKDTEPRDRYFMAAIFPKGLAAAVLATIPLQRGIAGGEFIMNVTFSMVLFTIVFTSVLIPMIDKLSFVRKFYAISFQLFSWVNVIAYQMGWKDRPQAIQDIQPLNLPNPTGMDQAKKTTESAEIKKDE